MNENWNRWIWASVTTYFKGALNSRFPVFIEGDDRNEVSNPAQSDFCEIRMNGPFVIDLSKNYWQLDIEISILITSIRDEQDVHKIYRMAGIVASAFVEDLPIYKYGSDIPTISNPNGPDDQSYLGCFQIRTDNKNRIAISQFGQIDPTWRVVQASVDGEYRMLLST